jgi:hypothetical protein
MPSFRRIITRLVDQVTDALDPTGFRGEPTFCEVASAARDPDFDGFGTSGNIGDASRAFLPIPKAPTTHPSKRYMARLCGIDVAAGQVARLITLAQYIELGTKVPDPQTGGFVPLRCQILSPNYAPPDGNVTWGIQVVPPNYQASWPTDPKNPVNFSTSFDGTDTAWLYVPNPAPIYGAVPYTPMSAAVFPGRPFATLGNIGSIVSPWGQNRLEMDMSVEGPCRIVFMVSIWQTDPATRSKLSTNPSNIGSLSREERFVAENPDAVYTRVGGSMVIEIGPLSRLARGRRRVIL